MDSAESKICERKLKVSVLGFLPPFLDRLFNSCFVVYWGYGGICREMGFSDPLGVGFVLVWTRDESVAGYVSCSQRSLGRSWSLRALEFYDVNTGLCVGSNSRRTRRFQRSNSRRTRLFAGQLFVRKLRFCVDRVRSLGLAFGQAASNERRQAPPASGSWALRLG